MKIIRFDAGFRFDDPNSFWGDPSFQLEPGDPGFQQVSPPNSESTHAKKPKKMKRQAYYPSRAAEQIVWLENFRSKLAGYQAALGLDATAVTARIADARWLIYVVGSWIGAVRPWSLSCTSSVNDAQVGDDSTLCVLPVFTPPTPPAGVVAVNNGALNRLFDMVATIKDANGYNDTIGTDLGLLGPEDTAPDFSTVQPVLTATINGIRVDITWGWGGYSKFLDMCEIEVDRGDGKGWVLLAFDTTPNYTDNTPMPATLTRWKYRAIYHTNDARVGIWSAEVSVTLGN